MDENMNTNENIDEQYEEIKENVPEDNSATVDAVQNSESNSEAAPEKAKEDKTTKSKKETKKKSALREALEWVYSIAIAIAIALLVKGFLFDIVKVDGHSMDPTLADGQRLIVTKLGYSPKVGDIIILDSNYKKREEYFNQENIQGFDRFIKNIFTPKDYKKVYYVKRVIATEGQTVEITGGDVFVDGVQLDESYIQGRTYTFEPDYKTTVEEGCVFVMGDNREHSADSRVPSVGQVPEEAVLGQAALRVFPFNQIGVVK